MLSEFLDNAIYTIKVNVYYCTLYYRIMIYRNIQKNHLCEN